jgi:hypothetical protein
VPLAVMAGASGGEGAGQGVRSSGGECSWPARTDLADRPQSLSKLAALEVKSCRMRSGAPSYPIPRNCHDESVARRQRAASVPA